MAKNDNRLTATFVRDTAPKFTAGCFEASTCQASNSELFLIAISSIRSDKVDLITHTEMAVLQ